MEKYIAILKVYVDMLQFLHWNMAKDYANHLLMERLMDEVAPLLDRFVEVSMGAKNVVNISYDEFKKEKFDNLSLVDFIKYAKGEFNGLLMESGETVQNVIVDILEMFDRHLYLL